MKLYPLIVFLLVVFMQNCYSQTRKELENERKQIEQQIEQINKNLDQSQSKRLSVIDKVQTINQRIAAAERLVRINNREANMLSREIDAN